VVAQKPRSAPDPDHGPMYGPRVGIGMRPYLDSGPPRESRGMSESVTIKAIFMILAVIVAVMVAVAAGLLTWLSKAHWATAVMRAGAAFAATLGLIVAVMTATHLI
jgi:hypothetical protein